MKNPIKRNRVFLRCDCERIQSLIAQVAENNCDETTRKEVTSHADHCRKCASALGFQRELNRAFSNAGNDAPPQLYFEGVLAEIHLKMPTPRVRHQSISAKRRYFIRRDLLADAVIAASFLFFCGAGHLNSLITFENLSETPTHVVREPMHSQMCNSIRAVDGMGWISSNSEILNADNKQLLQEVQLQALKKENPKKTKTIASRFLMRKENVS